jgi:pyruvate,orthophosphate dikinase
MGIGDEIFDGAMVATKHKHSVAQDVDLTAEQLKELADQFLAIYREQTGHAFPADPYEQLRHSIEAVFRSWNGKRAVDYRRQFRITKEMANGTAVNVVMMVFGNMGEDSATGVGFTRNPATGENAIYGEYLTNAQGEDVVAGIRTPKPIAEMVQEMPELYRQLVELRNRLEAHYKEGPALLLADAQRQDECARHGENVGRDVHGWAYFEGARSHAYRADAA